MVHENNGTANNDTSFESHELQHHLNRCGWACICDDLLLAQYSAAAILRVSTHEKTWKGEDQIVSSPETEKTLAARPTSEHLQGIVECVTFHSEESGYTVARLKTPGERDLVTIIGRFPEMHAGQTLRLTGFWREHPKYGQLSVPTFV